MMTKLGRYRLRSVGLIALVVALMSALATPAMAAGATITTRNLTASSAGSLVTVSTTIVASYSTTASLAGICARSISGAKRDFPLAQWVTLTPAGTTITKTQALPLGGYTYWSCAKINGVWRDLDAKKSFTVVATPPPPVIPVDPNAPSGESMPIGNLPGWTKTFSDDFTSPLALGGFPGVYGAKWMSYNGFPDSRNKGDYNQNIISAHDGLLDLYLHQENGRAQVAAPVPLINGQWGGQTYGKFSVRFKSDALTGYGAAWLLWPDSNIWNEGEIDFPEGGLDQTIWGFNHCINNPSVNCEYINTYSAYTSWHTTSIEWTPTKVSFLFDGVVIKVSTSALPSNPMHWVLQTETGAAALVGASGHLLIDWVSAYSYNG